MDPAALKPRKTAAQASYQDGIRLIERKASVAVLVVLCDALPSEFLRF
jgi:hypothetical protein